MFRRLLSQPKLFKSAAVFTTLAAATATSFSYSYYQAQNNELNQLNEFANYQKQGGMPSVQQNFMTSYQADEVPLEGLPGTRHERTFIAVKPDGIHRGNIGEVIQRFERKGFKLVGMKLVCPSKEQMEKHYEDLKDKPFYPKLVNYMSEKPLVVMCWEGRNVIKGGRNLMGQTDPMNSAPGSIRGDLAVDIGRNTIHGSATKEDAFKEIPLWFNKSEIVQYNRVDESLVYED